MTCNSTPFSAWVIFSLSSLTQLPVARPRWPCEFVSLIHTELVHTVFYWAWKENPVPSIWTRRSWITETTLIGQRRERWNASQNPEEHWMVFVCGDCHCSQICYPNKSFNYINMVFLLNLNLCCISLFWSQSIYCELRLFDPLDIVFELKCKKLLALKCVQDWSLPDMGFLRQY